MPGRRVAQRVVDQVGDERVQLRLAAGHERRRRRLGAEIDAGLVGAARRSWPTTSRATRARSTGRNGPERHAGLEAREVEQLLHQPARALDALRAARRAPRRAPPASAPAARAAACSASAETGERSSCAASARKRRCASSEAARRVEERVDLPAPAAASSLGTPLVGSGSRRDASRSLTEREASSSGARPRVSAQPMSAASSGIRSSIGISTGSDSSRASASRAATGWPTCTMPSGVTCV